MSHDEVVLKDITRAVGLAIAFRQGMSKEEFMVDVKTQSAVLHQLLVIGEAVKRLSTSFREEHPAVPWRDMSGMRDVLIHGYDIVDLEEVWKTVDTDLPGLLRILEEFAQ